MPTREVLRGRFGFVALNASNAFGSAASTAR
jgi:hypothetical protein